MDGVEARGVEIPLDVVDKHRQRCRSRRELRASSMPG